MLTFKTSAYFFEQLNFFHQLWTPTCDNIHNHEFFEIFYVLSGSSLHYLNGETEELTTGDLRLLRPRDFHCCLGTTTSSNTVHRNFLIKAEEFKQACEFLSPSMYSKLLLLPCIKLKFSPSCIKETENMLEQLTASHVDDVEYKNTLYRLTLLHILKSLFLELGDTFINSNTPPLVANILHELDKPQGLLFSAKDVLNESTYNHSYICRLFKQHTGVSISQYINNKRLDYAEMLIKTTNLSLNEIAESVGYQNYSYFHRKYLERFKELPKKAKIRTKDNK